MALGSDELVQLRDALLRARASGTRSVTYDGKRVEYGSDSEMAAALADLDSRIRGAGRTRVSTIKFSSSKGI